MTKIHIHVNKKKVSTIDAGSELGADHVKFLENINSMVRQIKQTVGRLKELPKNKWEHDKIVDLRRACSYLRQDLAKIIDADVGD